MNNTKRERRWQSIFPKNSCIFITQVCWYWMMLINVSVDTGQSLSILRHPPQKKYKEDAKELQVPVSFQWIKTVVESY